jgi:hypothetical protein
VRWTTLLAFALCLAGAPFTRGAPRIQVVPIDYASRVDVLLDGRPFTSYVHLSSMRIPALTPIHDSEGTAIHAFTLGHGNVNGIDFSAKPQLTAIRGRIVMRRIIEAVSADEEGRLSLEADWLGPDEEVVLKEHTWLTFRATSSRRSIDRVSRLSALRGRVVLGGSGGPGLTVRLAEEGDRKAGKAHHADGTVTDGAGGRARSRWIAVSAAAGPRQTTVAVFDHPSNPGFPPYAGVDSGLLALTPAARVEIESGSSRTLRYRLLVASDGMTRRELEKEFEAFARQ